MEPYVKLYKFHKLHLKLVHILRYMSFPIYRTSDCIIIIICI